MGRQRKSPSHRARRHVFPPGSPIPHRSLLLSAIGGAVGLVLAFFATDFLLAIFPRNISNLSVPLIDSIPIDARVFAFTFAIVALAGVLFGLFPILHAVGRDISENMHGASRSVTSLCANTVSAAPSSSPKLRLL